MLTRSWWLTPVRSSPPFIPARAALTPLGRCSRCSIGLKDGARAFASRTSSCRRSTRSIRARAQAGVSSTGGAGAVVVVATLAALHPDPVVVADLLGAVERLDRVLVGE